MALRELKPSKNTFSIESTQLYNERIDIKLKIDETNIELKKVGKSILKVAKLLADASSSNVFFNVLNSRGINSSEFSTTSDNLGVKKIASGRKVNKAIARR